MSFKKISFWKCLPEILWFVIFKWFLLPGYIQKPQLNTGKQETRSQVTRNYNDVHDLNYYAQTKHARHPLKIYIKEKNHCGGISDIIIKYLIFDGQSEINFFLSLKQKFFSNEKNTYTDRFSEVYSFSRAIFFFLIRKRFHIKFCCCWWVLLFVFF